MDNFTDRVGETYITNQGCKLTIIEYFNSINCTVKFENSIVIKNVSYNTVKNGGIKNVYYPSVYDVGYKGIGIYRCKTHPLIYKSWAHILERGYSKKYKLKFPTYKDVTVCTEWHCFQNFASWYEENWKPYMEGWHLDKDILLKGNKIYSPETCAFVPSELNTLFNFLNMLKTNPLLGIRLIKGRYQVRLGKNKSSSSKTFNTETEALQAYKTSKEIHIKEMAEKWKHLISKEVYQIMCNYKI